MKDAQSDFPVFFAEITHEFEGGSFLRHGKDPLVMKVASGAFRGNWAAVHSPGLSILERKGIDTATEFIKTRSQARTAQRSLGGKSLKESAENGK